MKLKIHKKLNEELISGTTTIVVPTKIKLSCDDEEILSELKDVIFTKVVEEVDFVLHQNLLPYVEDNRDNISTQLNIDELAILDMDLYDVDKYDTVPIMSGNILFDIQIYGFADRGRIRQVFNTLINNNVLYKEFDCEIENDLHGTFVINVILEKEEEVEVEDYD